MYPLLPFAVGLLTGALGIRLLKAGRTRATLDKAQERLREATVSSLSAIEHSSAQLRARLVTEPEAPTELSAPAVPAKAAPVKAASGRKATSKVDARSKETPEPKVAPRRTRKPATQPAGAATARAPAEKPAEDKQ